LRLSVILALGMRVENSTALPRPSIFLIAASASSFPQRP
jgi:hypothetical protein